MSQEPYKPTTGSLVPSRVDKSQEIIPLEANLLVPRKVDWSSQENIHAKIKGLVSLDHVSWYYLAQGLEYIVQNKKWKEVRENFDDYCNDFLGRSPGYVSRTVGFYNWIQEHAPKDYKVIPRFQIMGLVANYSEAFIKNPKLTDLVFNQGCNDRHVIIGEIRRSMGVGYLAEKAPANTRSQAYGGSFKPRQQSDSGQSSLVLLIQRVYTLVVERNAWKKLSRETKNSLSGMLEDIVNKVNSDGAIQEGQVSSAEELVTQATHYEPEESLDVFVEGDDPVTTSTRAPRSVSMKINNNGSLTQEDVIYLQGLNPEEAIFEDAVIKILGINPSRLDGMDFDFKPVGSTSYTRLRNLSQYITDSRMVQRLKDALQGVNR